MLVLTRKPGEQIVIGDNIKVSIVSIGPGRVKIGIEAPPWVAVNRQEVFEAKQAEKDPADVSQPTPAPMPGLPPAPEVLHNRIADKLPAEQPAPAQTVAVAASTEPSAAPAQIENRVKSVARRLPRKPR